jgi:copper/silver efflux system protein
MIERTLAFSLRRPGLVAALACLAALWGWRTARTLPQDALPELGDPQVIVLSRWDRSADLVEDQVTYPLVTRLMGSPRVKTVRGVSDFGYSYVYVIFEDGTDLYWARSRTQELLAAAAVDLPAGVKTVLGPDATGLGWVFQYAVTDQAGKRSLAELRSIQDWYLRYHLRSVPGVAEVAAVGGFEQQYQVAVDPVLLKSYGLSIGKVVEAVRKGNSETGGRLLEASGTEYMIRGRGYARTTDDIANIVVAGRPDGSGVRVGDVARVGLGPEMRRGLAELDGRGETVSGIVVVRQGANAREVIRAVKAKLREIAPGLPEGVAVRPVYDRSELIDAAVGNLKSTLLEVVATVVVVVVAFLGFVPGAVIPVVTIPVALLAVLGMLGPLGVGLNIMSLGGLAIGAGALVDAGIVVVEQAQKRLEEAGSAPSWKTAEITAAAVREVARPACFALLVTAVAFLPVLALEGQDGRLFHPLAYAKSLTIMVGAVLAITFDPALRMLLARFGAARPARPEADHPISGALMRAYEPLLRRALRRKGLVFGAVALAAVATVPVALRLTSELMPPLDEGTILYMPSTAPGISIAEASRLLRTTDAILKGFPEVETVLGKAGRADTATDPAPLSMLETLVILKPKEQWPKMARWYSGAPEPAAAVLRRFWPDRISHEELVAQMDAALRLPGVANSWTMPVRGRVDMQATGIRSGLGIKVTGADVEGIERVGKRIEAILRQHPGTRSVYAERLNDGRYLDIEWDRKALARYGIGLEPAQQAVENAIGGEDVGVVIDGRARYPVNVRYLRDFRSDLDTLREVLVRADDTGLQVPLGELAAVRLRSGPSMIRDENGLLTGYVFVDPSGGDTRSYRNGADELLRQQLQVPAGYTYTWSGQYEEAERTWQRLTTVVPLTLGVICVLLYANTRSARRTALVLLAVPLSAIGAVWALWLLGYHMSVAVWVGLIALLGVDAQTGVFMLLYLDLAFRDAERNGRARSAAEVEDVVLAGAARRVRPKFMTVATMFVGLLPILLASGTGSDVMKRIAAPILGGLATSFAMELMVYPLVYHSWVKTRMPAERQMAAAAD